MKKRCEEKENQKKERRDKEWDHVSIHTVRSSKSCERHSKRKNEDRWGDDDSGKAVTKNLEYAQLKTFPLLGDNEREEG